MEEFLAKQKLLVIAPHADDEVFGCAGTMAKVKSLGGEVYVVVVSVGDIEQYTGHSIEMQTGKTRKEEFLKALEIVGVDDYDILFDEPRLHLRLDTIPRRDLIEKLERTGKLAMDKLQPTIVTLPAISYNQDHEAVFRAGFTACRPHVPWVKPFQRIVLAYDNTSLSWAMEREKFHPNFYVDISAYLDKKLAALNCYNSQAKPSVHHASVENVANWAKVRGREVSVEAAEAYMCLRFVL